MCYLGKRESNVTGSNHHSTSSKILKEHNTPDKSKDLYMDERKGISTNLEYSETKKVPQTDSNLNTLQFNLEGTHDFSHQRNNMNQHDIHSDGNTPMKMT